MEKTKLAAIAIVAVLIIAVGVIATGLGNGTQIAYQNQTSTASNQILFATSQLAPYSYLISGSSLSPQAKAALAGYNLTTTALQNGTVEMKISVVGTGLNQTVQILPGYKLYIVETSFGDDSDNFDSSRADDSFVLVDPSGYIVQ